MPISKDIFPVLLLSGRALLRTWKSVCGSFIHPCKELLREDFHLCTEFTSLGIKNVCDLLDRNVSLFCCHPQLCLLQQRRQHSHSAMPVYKSFSILIMDYCDIIEFHSGIYSLTWSFTVSFFPKGLQVFHAQKGKPTRSETMGSHFHGSGVP